LQLGSSSWLTNSFYIPSAVLLIASNIPVIGFKTIPSTLLALPSINPVTPLSLPP